MMLKRWLDPQALCCLTLGERVAAGVMAVRREAMAGAVMLDVCMGRREARVVTTTA